MFYEIPKYGSDSELQKPRNQYFSEFWYFLKFWHKVYNNVFTHLYITLTFNKIHIVKTVLRYVDFTRQRHKLIFLFTFDVYFQ